MKKKAGWAQLGLGIPGSTPLRIGEEMVYFSSPSSLPKSRGFPFLVCEMQEGNLGKGCGQASTHTPNIPLPHPSPLSGGSRPWKTGNVSSQPCPQMQAGEQQTAEAPGDSERCREEGLGAQVSPRTRLLLDAFQGFIS